MGRLSKDKRDIYYREAKCQGFRARSAFKLLQIDDEIGLLKGVRNVADLCAAPGGWSQVLALRLGATVGGGGSCGSRAAPAVADGDRAEEAALPEVADEVAIGSGGGGGQESGDAGAKPRIVAVDMYPMQPIVGVVQVQGDITSVATVKEVLGHFDGELADLVVCDGAPDVTGRPDFDEYVQHQLLLSAQHLASALLRPGGSFCAKIFRGEHTGEVSAFLKRSFSEVMICKPRASRNSSQESFIVGRDFRPPEGFDREDALYRCGRHEELSYLGPGATSAMVPFVGCGGRDGLDADTSYPVSSKHRVLAPVAPPIRAPYKEALEERRGQKRSADASPATASSFASPSSPSIDAS